MSEESVSSQEKYTVVTDDGKKIDSRFLIDDEVLAALSAPLHVIAITMFPTPEDFDAQAAIERNKPPEKRSAGDVKIFDVDALTFFSAHMTGDKKDVTRKFIEMAQKNGGYRKLPKLDRVVYKASLDALYRDFPNFKEVIDFISCELILSMTGRCHEWRIHPFLLSGEPGIGKTHFCSALAKMIGSTLTVLQCGSMQGSFDLSGSSLHWSNTRPGKIFTSLATGDSASPLIVLDEIDKLHGDDRYDPSGALHDLLEVDTSRRFSDEAIEAPFDASHVIFAATTNNLDAISPAVKSRMVVLNIEPPTLDQRVFIARKIIEQEIGNREVILSDCAIDKIIADEKDLRTIRKMARQAVATALLDESSHVMSKHVTASRGSKKPVMGFI